MKQTFNFELDKKALEETMETLKKSVELPRRQITKTVKEAMKLPLEHAKYLLRSLPRDYTMTFEDGNTFTKQDIINNLYLKLERRGGKDKKVYQLLIKDPKVSNYAIFVEFGYYHNRGVMQRHFDSQFMRKALDGTAPELSKEIIEGLTKLLEKLGMLE